MMNEIDLEQYKSNKLSAEKLHNLINSKQSFQISAVKDMTTVVNSVISEIKQQNYRYRVYTQHRSAGIAILAFPGCLTQFAGLLTAVGIGVHNLVTYNPDFEVAKNSFKDTVTVFCKKN